MMFSQTLNNNNFVPSYNIIKSNNTSTEFNNSFANITNGNNNGVSSINSRYQKIPEMA